MNEILIIDNYDSFTFNLYQCVLALVDTDNCNVTVTRNDQWSPARLSCGKPAGIIVSPGPGRPANAGMSISCIEFALSHDIPLLGVCLGHQALATVFGARIIRADVPLHGYTSTIKHGATGIFKSVPDQFAAMRYHSLVVDPNSLPETLTVTATSDKDMAIMGLAANNYRAWGVQFHPESFLTAHGEQIIRNFLHEVQCAKKPSHRAA